MRLKPSLPRIDRSHSLSRGLKAAYPFFEGRGDSRLFDIAGRNHGTFVSSPTWAVTHPYGRALSFNGSTDAVSLPAILTSGGTELTVAALFKSNSNSTHQRVIAYNNEDQFWGIRINENTSGEVVLFAYDGTSKDVNVTSITTTDWVMAHMTVVEGSQIEGFIGGASQGTTAVGTFQTTTNLGRHIGASRTATGRFFDGPIAGIWLWDRKLSDGEIKNHADDLWQLFRVRRNIFAADSIIVPLGEVSVTGRIDSVVGVNSVSTKEFNRSGSFGVRVSMHGGITKDFRNVQTFAGAMGIVAELDGVVSTQFTREREGRIDIVAEFNSPVTFEKMKTGQLDAVVDLVAEKSEGDTPVTDQDIGEAIVFRVPKIDYVFRAKKHPTGRTL